MDCRYELRPLLSKLSKNLLGHETPVTGACFFKRTKSCFIDPRHEGAEFICLLPLRFYVHGRKRDSVGIKSKVF